MKRGGQINVSQCSSGLFLLSPNADFVLVDGKLVHDVLQKDVISLVNCSCGVSYPQAYPYPEYPACGSHRAGRLNSSILHLKILYTSPIPVYDIYKNFL